MVAAVAAAAVVGKEQNKCVLGQAVLVEAGQKFPDRLVHARDGRVVRGQALFGVHIRIAADERFRRLHAALEIGGEVRGVECQIEEEGLPPIVVYKAQSLALEEFGRIRAHVGLRAHVAAEHGVNAIALMRVVIDAVVAVPVEEIEAALQREETFGLAHIPFAHDARAVTGALQHVADGDFLRVEAERHFRRQGILFGRIPVFVAHKIVANVVIESVALGIAAGEDTAAGRGAGRPSRVKIGRADAFARQAVEMRGEDRLRSDDPEVGVALVVRDDQDDVGRTDCSAGIAEPKAGQGEQDGNEASGFQESGVDCEVVGRLTQHRPFTPIVRVVPGRSHRTAFEWSECDPPCPAQSTAVKSDTSDIGPPAVYRLVGCKGRSSGVAIVEERMRVPARRLRR